MKTKRTTLERLMRYRKSSSTLTSSELINRFQEELDRPPTERLLALASILRRSVSERPQHPELRIERTPDVCGGDARIAGTRVPIWVLEQCRRQGQNESEILASYPNLRAADLVAAWSYVEAHPEEIDRLICQNDEDEEYDTPPQS